MWYDCAKISGGSNMPPTMAAQDRNRIKSCLVIVATVVTSLSFASAQPATQGPSSQPAKPPFALPPESITVTASKPSDATIKAYVETRAVETHVAGRMAHWTNGVCPLTVGLRDSFTKYISDRIRDIAKAVGAPVNSNPKCRPNIEVMFTLNPQILLDNVRKKQPYYLGYYNSQVQADQLAIVTHPIQAWYTTTTVDMDGSSQIDNGTCHGGGMEVANSTPLPSFSDMSMATSSSGLYSVDTANLACAIAVHSTGSRLNDGISSGFFNVLIVADPSKLFDYEIGALGDYVAVLALSQPASLDSCQGLPSISNLLAKGCTANASWITDGDLAFLHGLYNVPNGYSLAAQRDELHFQMKKTLVTDKGN
jgi:hypothetical protein